MPAQILTLYDQMVTIGPTGQHAKLDIGPFGISDLNIDDHTLRAILLFKVKGVGAVNLTMQFNGHTPCVDAYSFDPAEPDSMRARSWHEHLMVRENLRRQNNSLHVTVSGSGHVEVGDIVLFYHAN
jgi:hypothetical protein